MNLPLVLKNIIMKKVILMVSIISRMFSLAAQQTDYSRYPVYNGNDLGLTYSKVKSVFKIWSPVAEKAQLLLYSDGVSGSANRQVSMKKSTGGTWVATINGNLAGTFYTFRVQIKGVWSNEVADPYAKSCGANGQRAMVADIGKTNPEGWVADKSPVFKNKTDAVIYELHVRDASISPSSGIRNKGKFIGLTEVGTKNAGGASTGISHLKELGVTHIHLLPVFDFRSVDETASAASYNWGYDPLNYNIPEGSYATNPYDGLTRIKEFKKLVQAFHANGMRVVMDVVYNHTALTERSNFNQLVPGYYYRHTKDGKFSDATACGNETASERPMFRKFMIESMKYWVQEYHIDGFRVDLMGVHDIETMNQLSKELHKIKPDILLYGEGWTAGASPLPDSLRAIKANAHKLDRIAVFSDDIRDGIKGSVFVHDEKGFASGQPGTGESIRFGIAAACQHPQVDYTKINYSKAPYAVQPYQTITYCECHDNHTLWDKLAISAKSATAEERQRMHQLALSIVLTSQGISFLHAGTEFLRDKKGVENSYNSPDTINAIDWDLKTKNKEVFEYVKTLIKMRKEHPAFRMADATSIKENISFLDMGTPGFIVYEINGAAVGDKWKTIRVYLNGSSEKRRIKLLGSWKQFIHNYKAAPFNDEDMPVPGLLKSVEMNPYSCTILYQE